MASHSHQDVKSFLFAGSTLFTTEASGDEVGLPNPTTLRPPLHQHLMGPPPFVVSSMAGHDLYLSEPMIFHPNVGNPAGTRPHGIPSTMTTGPTTPAHPHHVATALGDRSELEQPRKIARVHASKKEEEYEAMAGPLYDFYLEPSPGLLAEGRVPHMGVLRPGMFHGRVGLLPGMHGEFMQKYEKPPKSRRAPREDLSIYTAEEKVERRKSRARAYSSIARQRQEAAENEFKFDLGFMRSFRMILEEGPNMFAVVTPDLDSHILYANNAFDRVANMVPKWIVGGPLWKWIHEEDHSTFRQALVSVILTKAPPDGHVPCRIVCTSADGYLDVQVSLAMGTQGVLCLFWVV